MRGHRAYVCCIVILAAATPCAANLFSSVTEAGNLFRNGDFEKQAGNDLSNWLEAAFGSTGATLTVISDNLVAYSGNTCVKLEAPKGRIGVMQGARAFPGKHYVASFFAKGSGRVAVSLHLYRRVGHHIKGLALPKGYKRRFVFDVSAQWKQYTVKFTGPEGLHSMNLSIHTHGKGPVYIDKASLAYAHPATVRFLPSVERLVVSIDAGVAKTDRPALPEVPGLKAEVAVYRLEAERGQPIVRHTVSGFNDGKAVWRWSTRDLPEGDYTVRIRIMDSRGKVLAQDDDWFKKKIFPWMKDKPWRSTDVFPPYTPLEVQGNRVSPWGRQYAFGKSGLLTSVVSQKRELLAEPLAFHAQVDDRPVKLTCRKPFAVTSRKPGVVLARSELAAGRLGLSLSIVTEFDGLILYRLTYRPLKGAVKINRLRLRVPLKEEHAFLYSAGTDRHGTHILGDVFPKKQGILYDSLNNTRCAYCSPTFCTLLWVGGYDTCFCYASDSDKGWILRDDAPAVEVHREHGAIVLWLNLVDQAYVLQRQRSLEFAFQAGPLKPLPKGWRGIQHGGNPADAPLTVVQARYQGASAGGGMGFLYPGATEDVRKRMRQLRESEIAGGKRALTGYHFYSTAPKGLEETKVFRSEWGIDKDTWHSITGVYGSSRGWMWKQRLFGDEKDRYVLMGVTAVPSYVDCASYGYNEVLKCLPFSGFYDDVGLIRQVYDEELGLGGRDIRGRRIYSSGLWIYRTRWKQAAYINHLNNRPNFLKDSQHVRAHFMPAYGFIGLWAPCERGYYNRYKDKDILEFYGSLEQYLACNPAHQFGQVPMVGLSTKKTDEAGAAKDTRCIMMVTMLHDHDVGSFGARNLRTVCKLRQARNVFRQWEAAVQFVGYWENAQRVASGSDDIKVSMYTRPGSALFIVGNIGEAGVFRIRPGWKALAIDPKTARLGDPETGEDIPLKDGAFSIAIPRHDLRLVLAGDLSGYAWRPPGDPGRDLPKPATVLAELSDALRGPKLAPAWTVDVHKGNAGAGFVDGRLFVQYSHYGYAYVRRKLGQDNVSVQCTILGSPTGCADTHCAGLGLWWDNGAFVRAIPGYNKGRFYYEIKGMRSAYGAKTDPDPAPRWYPYSPNGVKIQLAPKAVRFFVSTDGKTWKLDREVDRPAALAGAPAWALLGNGGSRGKEPMFKNVISRHFRPERANRVTFFADFVVGRP